MPNVKLLQFQAQFPVRFVKARRQYIWDAEGRKYVDFNTGNGIAFLGHGNPLILRKVKEALKTIYTLPPSFPSPHKEEALEALERIAPPGLTSIAVLNTGSEAVELALKLVFKYRGKDKKVVSFTGSFHGRTLGALSVTSNPAYKNGFPTIPNVVTLRYNSVEDIEKTPFDDVAGVIVEVVQGEGGVIPATLEFLKALWEKCRSNDVPLVVDEVQTGFGRTGRLWAYMHYGVEPDVLIAGKALGGGLPVSVVFSRADIGSRMLSHEHGSTFGFNPLAAAAVAGSVEAYFRMRVESKAEANGARLLESLRKVAENAGGELKVRGLGLMAGLDVGGPPSKMAACYLRRGVLVSKAGTSVVRFLPPFLITERDIRHLADATVECWEELHGKGAAKEALAGARLDTLVLGVGAGGS